MRWSDAEISHVVTFEFFNNLPRKILLEINLLGFGPNIGRDMKVVIGDNSYFVKLPEKFELLTIPVDLSKDSRVIELISPVPISPLELKQSTDARKLCFGISNIAIK